MTISTLLGKQVATMVWAVDNPTIELLTNPKITTVMLKIPMNWVMPHTKTLATMLLRTYKMMGITMTTMTNLLQPTFVHHEIWGLTRIMSQSVHNWGIIQDHGWILLKLLKKSITSSFTPAKILFPEHGSQALKDAHDCFLEVLEHCEDDPGAEPLDDGKCDLMLQRWFDLIIGWLHRCLW